MKSPILRLLAAATTLLAACTDELIPSASDRETIRIEARCELPTRSQLNGLQLLWSSGDQIGVFATGVVNEPFTTTAESAAANATFVGELPSGTTQITAYYPYDSQVRLADQQLTLTLPAEQPFFSNNSFGTGLNPAIASGEINSGLQFTNLCGVIRLQLTGNVEIKQIEFRPHNRAASGQAQVDLSQSPRELVLTNATPPASVTLTQIGQQLGSTATTYYIVVPTGDYQGFTIAVTDAQGKVTERTTQKTLTIKRAVIAQLAPFEVVSDPVVAQRDTVWIRGINPPATRWKHLQTDIYDIDYIPAYKDCGWYDVDKQYQTGLKNDVIADMFYSDADYYMCWAATAANLAHYFLDQYHDELMKIPDFPNRTWRSWLVNSLKGNTDGHISEIMEEFKRYYGDSGGSAPNGYRDFLCGDNRMPGYLKGILTDDEIYALQRSIASPSAEIVGSQIKRLTASNGFFSFSVMTPGGGHAITGWGAVFSPTGALETVFISNSDDPAGLRSLRVIAEGNRSYFQVSKSDKRWAISAIHLYESPEALIRSKIPQ